MKIKTLIIISYIAIIVTVAFLLYISNYFVVRNATRRNVNLVIEYEDKLSARHLKKANSILLPYERRYIKIETEYVARKLSDLIRNKKYRNCNEMQEDTQLRKIATQKIYSSGDVVGYTEVFDDKGTGVLSPNPRVQGVNYKQWESEFPALYKLMEKALSGEYAEGFYTFYGPGGNHLEKKYISLVHIPETKFIVASTVYMDKYLAPITSKITKAQTSEFDILREKIDDTLENSLVYITVTNLIIMVIMSLIALLIGYWLAGRISGPIERLQNGVQKIGEGNFDIQVDEYGCHEIVFLARTFNELGKKLKMYVENLKKETFARKAIEDEVKIVAHLQQSILPDLTEEFRNERFCLDARLLPAKEACGDFYDFFNIGDHKVAMLIADVSGKDLSAAFFMTMTKTLTVGICQYYPDRPDEALKEINTILVRDNKESMFITMFLIYYDLKSGEMVYANAGHHASLKVDTQGALTEFGVFKNPVLGFLEDSTYQMGKEKLLPGDKLLLYTDGATDARSESGEFYGEERIKRLLEEYRSLPVDEICQLVVKDIKEFEGKSQFDDITLLALHRKL